MFTFNFAAKTDIDVRLKVKFDLDNHYLVKVEMIVDVLKTFRM